MRKRQKRFNYGQRCTPVSLDAYSLDSVSVYNSVRRKGAIRASKRSYGNPAFEDTENISHPMNFSKLANFAHNDEGIAKEYDDIPVITAQASEVPLGCESKNRYANVIPLPETRVYLTKIEGDINSDYINANFIRGPKNSKAFYIATQAPLENTIDDFWRMIWEQQSKLVIQVTDLYENGVEKCFDYLPPSEVLDCHRQFGDFQITLKKREVKEKYIIHSIQLKNMVSNSWREITHLWYLGWPERGVPSEVDSLIAFLIEARSYTKSNTNSTTDNEDDKVSLRF